MLYQKIKFNVFKESSIVSIDSKDFKLRRVKNSKGVTSEVYLDVSCIATVYNNRFNHLGGIVITVNEPVRVLTAFGSIELKKRQSWGDYSDLCEDKFYIPVDKLMVDSLLVTIEELAIEKAFNKIYQRRNEFVFQPINDLIHDFSVNDTLDIKDIHDLSDVEVFDISITKQED